MARSCYIHLKLKMPGPNGVITISGDFEHSNECDVTNANITEFLIMAEELAKIQKSVNIEQLPRS